MVSFKIILMIAVITILVSTTSNIELTIGIEDLLHPLSYLRIPINE
jgi:energy-coupling factor transport system permease protein